MSALYCGQLRRAIETLEDLINSDPQRNLNDTIVFNLSTLYELESSQATVKKINLLRLINKHKGNGFNVSCLKLVQ